MEKLKVKFIKNGIPPYYRRPGDAGCDITAAMDVSIPPGCTAMVRTGLRLELPEGVEAQIRPRSGLSCGTPLRIANAPGTIDSSFRGEIMVLIENTSDKYYVDEEGVVRPLPDIPNNHHTLVDACCNLPGWYDIKMGDRIAQFVFARYVKVEFVDVRYLSETERGEGGFGSTGLKE